MLWNEAARPYDGLWGGGKARPLSGPKYAH
jgi:hypothetical protein